MDLELCSIQQLNSAASNTQALLYQPTQLRSIRLSTLVVRTTLAQNEQYNTAQTNRYETDVRKRKSRLIGCASQKKVSATSGCERMHSHWLCVEG